MDINSFEVFLKLSTNLHFARTAQECFMTPSTLTRLVQRWEEEIGAPLFERDKRRVCLTPVGEKFRNFAEHFTTEWKHFHNQITQHLQSLSGTLRIYCSVTTSYTLLDRILMHFRKKYPHIGIKLFTESSTDPLAKILQGETDIAITIKPGKISKNLLQCALTTCPLRFIVAKNPLFNPALLRSESTINDQVPFIVQKQGEIRKRLEKWFRVNKVKPNIYSEVDGNEAVFALINMGYGVGVVSDLFLNNNPQKNNIRILHWKPELPPYTVIMCTSRKGFSSPLVQAFWHETEVTLPAAGF